MKKLIMLFLLFFVNCVSIQITTPVTLNKTFHKKIPKTIKFTIENNITAKRFYRVDIIFRNKEAKMRLKNYSIPIIEKRNTINKPANRSNVIKYNTKINKK